MNPERQRRQAARAARSFAYNQELKPLVEDRLDRAKDKLRAYLSLTGQDTVRLGEFEVGLDEENELHIRKLEPDSDWRQGQFHEMEVKV